VLGGVDSEGVFEFVTFCDFETFLVPLAILAWFAAFRAFCLACDFSLLLDDLLELFHWLLVL
jgi:hypothetical protein